jgi:formylglycine-generating enzyme required for sulfatase activity
VVGESDSSAGGDDDPAPGRVVVASDSSAGGDDGPAPGRVVVASDSSAGGDDGPANLAGLDWVRVPGGRFQMGSAPGEEDSLGDERPQHPVTVADFELARTETTWAEYARCVAAGACSPARKSCLSARFEQSQAQPAVCLDWTQARAFCAWAGGRLPSEAEWEYAARSGEQGWRYPWGDTPAPTCERAVMDDGRTKGSAKGTTSGCGEDRAWDVCSKRAGNSAHGLCDLAGNVWEWVEDDWHDSYAAAGRPDDGTAWVDSPRGSRRVYRGGSFWNAAANRRAANRSRDEPGLAGDGLGFRCARSAAHP